MKLSFRLSATDLDALDRVRGYRSRSEAIRALIREAASTTPPQSRALAELHDQMRASEAAARQEQEQDTVDLVRQARWLSTGT